MSTNDLLFRMFRYQSWANEAVLNGLKEVNAESHPGERHLAIRLMNHCLVVDKIFAAHLVGEPHGFEADNTPETPELDALRQALATADRYGWPRHVANQTYYSLIGRDYEWELMPLPTTR